jgi:hypothetical protein
VLLSPRLPSTAPHFRAGQRIVRALPAVRQLANDDLMHERFVEGHREHFVEKRGRFYLVALLVSYRDLQTTTSKYRIRENPQTTII